jgi:L-fuculose-phosphate aldolase
VENVRAMEGSTKALLANHGVFVVGHNVPQVHLRCISLEHRCKLAYKVETLGGGVEVRREVRAKLSGRVDDGYIWPNNFESAARREIRKDTRVLL